MFHAAQLSATREAGFIPRLHKMDNDIIFLLLAQEPQVMNRLRKTSSMEITSSCIQKILSPKSKTIYIFMLINPLKTLKAH